MVTAGHEAMLSYLILARWVTECSLISQDKLDDDDIVSLFLNVYAMNTNFIVIALILLVLSAGVAERPLETDEDVNNWLKFYNVSSPFICLSVFINHEPVSSHFYL